MNKEELIKMKQEEIKSSKEWESCYKDGARIYSEIVIKLEAEIAELENKTTAPLTFLQLAEKYDKYFANKMRHIFNDAKPLFWENKLLVDASDCLKVSSWIASTLYISTQQARKFVAEIYLTLLAKELNGEEIDFKNDNQEKYEVFLDYSMDETLRVLYCPAQKKYGTIIWLSEEIAQQALTYSLEAETMWLWYFGKEGKNGN